MSRLSLSKVVTDAIKASRATDSPVKGLVLLSRGPQIANLLAKAANQVNPETKEKVTAADLTTFLIAQAKKSTNKSLTNADETSAGLLAALAVAFRDGKGYEQASANLLNFVRTGQAQSEAPELPTAPTPSPAEAPKAPLEKLKVPTPKP